MNKLKLVLAAGIAALSSAVIMAPTASAVTDIMPLTEVPAGWRRIGGIDLNRACDIQYGLVNGVRHPSDAVLQSPGNAMSWRCRRIATGQIVGGLDLDFHCGAQHTHIPGGNTSRAFFVDFNNPFSWGCYVRN
ncbi:hypothetical protein FWC63_02170 [Candidatus Saccharibacteria bacterium]|nr:hypothetical protein [Candidatus Saccharibacteria bacterium]